jgi:hypothetical protein
MLQPRRVKPIGENKMQTLTEMLISLVGIVPVMALAYLHIEGYTERWAFNAICWVFGLNAEDYPE